MAGKIMNLNNEITQLNTNLEQIDNEKSQLKSEEEESSSKHLAKMSELSKIFMAINNLQDVCIKRKGDKVDKLSFMFVDKSAQQTNFDLYQESQKKAIVQLANIR